MGFLTLFFDQNMAIDFGLLAGGADLGVSAFSVERIHRLTRPSCNLNYACASEISSSIETPRSIVLSKAGAERSSVACS